MKKPRVAINGFGRIGKQIFRANLKKNTLDIVAVNDLGGAKESAHLLKYDSLYGELPLSVRALDDTTLEVDGKKITVVQNRDPAGLPWKKLNIDIVIEATGFFCDKEKAMAHIKAGAKQVVITAPAKNADATFVLGVNEKTYDPKQHVIVSNASCTTNALAPVAKVLNDSFGIITGLMTTIHAYTNDQRILDGGHKDLRRARAAALSLIPTSTGAAKAIGLVIPEIDGKLHGLAVRAPVPTVSIVDLVCEVKKPASADEVNAAFEKAAQGAMKGILHVSMEELVSVDYRGSSYSSIVDGPLTMTKGNLVKVMAWYDNEWGYSERVVDLCAYIAGKN